jgi:hypothetical protein
VPLVGLAYDPKVRAILEGVGLADSVEPSADVTASSLLSRMERALDGRAARANAVAGAAASQRVLAEADLKGLAALLENPPSAPPITEDLVTLFDDAVTANIQRTQELGTLRADRAALSMRVAELEKRLGSTENVAEFERAEARRQLGVVRQSHRHEKIILEQEKAVCQQEKILVEQQLGEARVEINRIHSGRLWKAANLFWRARRVVGRVARSGRQALRTVTGDAPTEASGGPGPDWVATIPTASSRPRRRSRARTGTTSSASRSSTGTSASSAPSS